MRVYPDSHEEIGLLLGTHQIEEGKIVVRDRIPQNEELNSVRF